MAEWVPQADGLRQLAHLLRLSQDASSNQSQIYQQLEHLAQQPDISLYLLFLFNSADVDAVVRQCSGLFLKNVLTKFL